jgi:hypothetical protein
MYRTINKNDISNNISIDLSAYVLNTNFDLSFNDISNDKQNYFICIEPLIKNDISNNISINISDYNLGNIKGTKAILNEGYLDPSGNSLIFYHNNPGRYFTHNGFNSYFNLSSATITNNNNLAIVPFITNYNRIYKNGVNNAIKIASSGTSNSGINSSTYILFDSGSNPTPGANVGTIKFNIATFGESAVDRFVITPTTSIFYNQVGIGKTPSVNLDVSGHLNVTGNIYTTSIMTFGYTHRLSESFENFPPYLHHKIFRFEMKFSEIFPAVIYFALFATSNPLNLTSQSAQPKGPPYVASRRVAARAKARESVHLFQLEPSKK